jgi:hypothetical protein
MEKPLQWYLHLIVVVIKLPRVWNQKFTAVFTTAHRDILITWQIRDCMNLSCGPAEAGRRQRGAP